MGLLGLGRSGARRRLLARFGRNGVRGQGTSRGLRPFLSSRWHQPGLAAVLQVRLSLTLLIGAGLLLRSPQHLNKVDVGFDRENVLVIWVLPTMVGYDTPKEYSLYWQLLDRLSAVPGVQSARLSRCNSLVDFGLYSDDSTRTFELNNRTPRRSHSGSPERRGGRSIGKSAGHGYE